ncbi:MAG: hypothetical protein HC916_00435 [Coleofasciculaceae cyanobacterium SM2_1_6]|nr:hypothetical protein [Coleofasciculaceae cyanobacterium SM2_1_6]
MTQHPIPNNCMEPQLKTNPFHTYRDPKTGEWKVVLPPPNPKPQFSPQEQRSKQDYRNR